MLQILIVLHSKVTSHTSRRVNFKKNKFHPHLIDTKAHRLLRNHFTVGGERANRIHFVDGRYRQINKTNFHLKITSLYPNYRFNRYIRYIRPKWLHMRYKTNQKHDWESFYSESRYMRHRNKRIIVFHKAVIYLADVLWPISFKPLFLLHTSMTLLFSAPV